MVWFFISFYFCCMWGLGTVGVAVPLFHGVKGVSKLLIWRTSSRLIYLCPSFLVNVWKIGQNGAPGLKATCPISTYEEQVSTTVKAYLPSMFCVSQQVLRYRDSVSLCFATVFMWECFLKVFNCYEFQALYQYMTKFRGVKGVFHFWSLYILE